MIITNIIICNIIDLLSFLFIISIVGIFIYFYFLQNRFFFFFFF